MAQLIEKFDRPSRQGFGNIIGEVVHRHILMLFLHTVMTGVIIVNLLKTLVQRIEYVYMSIDDGSAEKSTG